MKNSLTNQLRLKLCLYTIRMDDGISLCDNLAVFTLILNDLAKLDVKVEDEDQALLLLCSIRIVQVI
jgi:gag-polypeptide of LTR copia-type